MIIKVVKKVLKEEHPDLQSIHYPVKAVITKVHEDGSYVDIKVLDKNGNIDESIPEIPRVKTNNLFNINEVVIEDEEINIVYKDVSPEQTRVIHFPDKLKIRGKILYQVGEIVRVGFYYNDLSMPYIERKVE